MSILQILEKNYYYSVEKIKNTNNRNKKREYITELILNLQKADIKFSQRELSSCLGVSRQLIKSILDTISFKMNFIQYLIYFLLLFFVKIETRGRKKTEVNNPEIIIDIEKICENTKHIDKRLNDEIIYTDVTLGLVQEKLKKDYNYDYVPSKKTISRITKEKLGFKITRVKKDVIFKRVKETDDIFANVFSRIKEIKSSSNNILAISIDDKVAKYIGMLSGMGKSWLEKHTLDHDTNPTFIARPFGIMDLKDKVVRVFCTISNSTANFKADCIEKYLIKK